MSEPDHQSKVDEVFRKIGRNVFYFQRLEALLKFLIARSTLNGNAQNFVANHKKSVDSVSRKTMGNLVKDLFPAIFHENGKELPEPEALEAGAIELSFKIRVDSDYLEERQTALAKIVEERNKLIHQMLSKFDPSSREKCIQLSLVLDEQVEKIRPELELFQQIAGQIRESYLYALDNWDEDRRV